MEPLRIRFHLDTPVVSPGYPIHLDALVAYAKTAQAMASMVDTCPNDSTLVRDLAKDLPLGWCDREEGGVWQASALYPVGEADHSIRMWTRRFNCDDFASKVMTRDIKVSTRMATAILGENPRMNGGLIPTNGGLMKNMIETYPVTTVHAYEAWCIGNLGRLEDLLAPESGFLTHLGKRTRIGHGRITQVEIDFDDSATEKWKKRVLPWKESDDYAQVIAATVPPYWAPENRVAAYMPIDL